MCTLTVFLVSIGLPHFDNTFEILWIIRGSYKDKYNSDNCNM